MNIYHHSHYMIDLYGAEGAIGSPIDLSNQIKVRCLEFDKASCFEWDEKKHVFSEIKKLPNNHLLGDHCYFIVAPKRVFEWLESNFIVFQLVSLDDCIDCFPNGLTINCYLGLCDNDRIIISFGHDCDYVLITSCV